MKTPLAAVKHAAAIWISVFSFAFAGSHLVAATNYVSTATYSIGIGPNNVAIVDANLDGKPDLVAANDGNSFDGNTLTVLTNNGHARFGFYSNYPVGKAPFVTAADLHGSGRPDLITANFADSTITVLTNNGSGDYGSNAIYNVGNGPFNIVATDVNHDGKLDLVTANDGTHFDGNTLTVLTNNGAGVCGYNATYTVGNLPSVTAADLRNTGRPDLITADYNDDSIMILTNDGAGSFGSNATYTVGFGPINVAAADVNGDHHLDLICANSAANTLTVLTNRGDGTFAWSSTLVVGNAPYVTAADANGDGVVDLVAANFNDGTLMVMTNNGSGDFGSNATYTVPGSPITVTAADLNKDGRTELVSANYANNSLTVRLELPQLDFHLANQTATLSWGPNWNGYELQTATNLAPGDWSIVNNPTATNFLSLPVNQGTTFYRLRHL